MLGPGVWGHRPPKSCPAPPQNCFQGNLGHSIVLLLVDVFGSIVISLSHFCIPNDEGLGPQNIFFLELPLWRMTVWVGPGPSIIGHCIGHHVVPVVRLLHTAMESTKAVLLLMLAGFLLYCDATSEPQHPHPKPPPVGPFVFIYISLS